MITEMQEKVLSDLYEIHHEQLGWLSHLEEMLHLSLEEREWLEWKDDQQAIASEKIKAWGREIISSVGWDIYNEEDDSKKLRLINKRISEIEREADAYVGDADYIFVGMSDLSKLTALRHKIRGRLIHRVFKEAIEELPEWLICKAREVPLRDIVEKFSRNRYIVCPFHAEKTPSFLVGKWGYCFGCGAWSDSIKWCMTQRSMTFVEAVKYLANLFE